MVPLSLTAYVGVDVVIHRRGKPDHVDTLRHSFAVEIQRSKASDCPPLVLDEDGRTLYRRCGGEPHLRVDGPGGEPLREDAFVVLVERAGRLVDPAAASWREQEWDGNPFGPVGQRTAEDFTAYWHAPDDGRARASALCRDRAADLVMVDGVPFVRRDLPGWMLTFDQFGRAGVDIHRPSTGVAEEPEAPLRHLCRYGLPFPGYASNALQRFIDGHNRSQPYRRLTAPRGSGLSGLSWAPGCPVHDHSAELAGAFRRMAAAASKVEIGDAETADAWVVMRAAAKRRDYSEVSDALKAIASAKRDSHSSLHRMVDLASLEWRRLAALSLGGAR